MELLVYEGKAALVLAAFWLCWRLLLQKDTFHRLNRAVLLGTAAAALVLPLCVITIDKTVEVQPMESVPMPAPAVAHDAWWPPVLLALYFAGAAFVLVRLLLSMLRIRRLVRGSEQRPQDDGTVLCINDSVHAPFSWMKWIVLSREDLASPVILSHEKAHVALRHSQDLLFIDLVTVIQWFNPAIWLLRQDLRALHEYEADAQVLDGGADAREYQYLLVRKAVAGERFSVANSFSHSTLKGRITMMCKHPSRRAGVWKTLFILPLLALTLTLSARTRYTYVGKKQDSSSLPFTAVYVHADAVQAEYYVVKEDSRILYPLSKKDMAELAQSGKLMSVEVHAPMIIISTKP
ncbi:MAG: M56 family metallopeptidase [Bacteroidales bacterium]|nr:M56 family metallopeptidase [Bacteroidales bacterium]